MINGFSGLNVFISINGRMFKPEELDLIQVEVSDDEEGDNEVELRCSDDDFKIADSALFRVGQTMSLKWGYINGEMSAERSGYVLMKPATNYTRDGVLSVITASTKSATLGARRPQKNYGPTSLRSIISDIAQRNGLKLEMKGGNERLNAFSQGNWSDRQVCRVLADRFNYLCTFSSESITFAPRDYGLPPTLTLVFANGEEGNILQADLNVDSKKGLGGDVATQAVNVNPQNKETKVVNGGEAEKALAVSADNGHTWTTKLQQAFAPTPTIDTRKIVQQIDQEVLANVPTDPVDIKTLLSSPDTMEANLQAHATAMKLTKQKRKGELSITTVGMPSAKSRIIVHVKGLAKRDSGNWYVSSVTHSISKDDGYTTKFELNRHGSNAGSGSGSDKTKSPLNAQQPQNAGTKTVEAVAVSADTGVTWRKK